MGSSVKREVELRTPHTAQTGRAITLTLTVQAEDTPDSNYAVVHLIVIPEVRTITIFYNEEVAGVISLEFYFLPFSVWVSPKIQIHG